MSREARAAAAGDGTYVIGELSRDKMIIFFAKKRES